MNDQSLLTSSSILGCIAMNHMDSRMALFSLRSNRKKYRVVVKGLVYISKSV